MQHTDQFDTGSKICELGKNCRKISITNKQNLIKLTARLQTDKMTNSHFL